MTTHAHALSTPAIIADEPASNPKAPQRSFRAIAGGGALLGALAGVVIAVPLAAAQGIAVFTASAIDMGIGLALIGGLIGANIAGTD